LEVYGEDGLVRSLAVVSEFQTQGCGSSLLQSLEHYSKSIGIKTLYLLTETAEQYFEGKGYESIDRQQASASIKETSQFSGLCPDSATLMRKCLRPPCNTFVY